MAYKLMVQGTTKGSGKSFVVIGLLQAFKELGFKVAPFKTVEISDEAFVTKEGADISKTVATLSFAAKEPHTLHLILGYLEFFHSFFLLKRQEEFSC